MADVNIKYKGSTISEFSATSTKTLLTAGKYCEDNIVVTYTKTAGSATTPAKTITANPTISINASGVITASVAGSSSITPTVSAGYVSAGTAGTVSVSGSSTYQLTTKSSANLTASGSQITAPAGYYAVAATKAVGAGTATTPAKTITANPTLSLNASTGVITASVTGSSSVTPTISAGYVSSGTAGTISVSGSSTLSLTTRSSANLTASGATVTAPSGYYPVAAAKSVTTMTLPSKAVSSPSGTAKATITPTTSSQYLNIPTGYNSTAQYYTIAPSGAPPIYRFREIPSLRTTTTATFSIDGTPYASLTTAQLQSKLTTAFGVIRLTAPLTGWIPQIQVGTGLKLGGYCFWKSTYTTPYEVWTCWGGSSTGYRMYGGGTFPKFDPQVMTFTITTADNRPAICATFSYNNVTFLPYNSSQGESNRYELAIFENQGTNVTKVTSTSDSGLFDLSSIYPNYPKAFFLMYNASDTLISGSWGTVYEFYLGEQATIDSLGISNGSNGNGSYMCNFESELLPYYSGSGNFNFGELHGISGLQYALYYLT